MTSIHDWTNIKSPDNFNDDIDTIPVVESVHIPTMDKHFHVD